MTRKFQIRLKRQSNLRTAIRVRKIRRLDEKQRKGYVKHPVKDDEFIVWEDEQVWVR